MYCNRGIDISILIYLARNSQPSDKRDMGENDIEYYQVSLTWMCFILPYKSTHQMVLNNLTKPLF